MSQRNMNPVHGGTAGGNGWRFICRMGGIAAFILVLIALLDIVLSFTPEGRTISPSSLSVEGWFRFIDDNEFYGLRHLGLFNIFVDALGIPVFLALYGVLRRQNEAIAIFALILYLVGTTIYITCNVSIPMLSLSNNYATATTDAQRSMVSAAGQALLARGNDFTPGSFPGFLFVETAGIVVSFIIRQSRAFSRSTALTGIFGNSFLLIFTFWLSFIPRSQSLAMVFGISGGLLSIAWHSLIARNLVKLSSRGDLI